MRIQPLTLIVMNVYWFGLAFMWNALHPIVLPALLLEFVPEDLKNTYLGAMTFAGLIAAMAIQPLAGALSDHTRLRWGRRRPWMVFGTLASLFALAWMAGARTIGILIGAYVFLQVVSNMAHGPAQGLIPDLVPVARHGMASGIKNFFDMGGLIVTSLVAGRLVSRAQSGWVFVAVGGILFLCAAITIIMTRERAQDRSVARGVDLGSLLHPHLERYPFYGRLLTGRFLILLGIYVVQGFAQYYLRDWLHVADPALVTGNLMATIGVALTLCVFPAGWLSDRVGRWALNVAAGALAALGIFLLVWARSVPAVYAFGAFIGIGTGVFLSVNWALATDLIPPQEAGKYLGLSNLATAGAGALSRLGGPLIDGMNALWPGTAVGYPVMFGVAAMVTLGGTIWLALAWRQARQLSGVEVVAEEAL